MFAVTGVIACRYCLIWSVTYHRQLHRFKTCLLGRGFHTFIRNVSFSSPTNVECFIKKGIEVNRMAKTTSKLAGGERIRKDKKPRTMFSHTRQILNPSSFYQDYKIFLLGLQNRIDIFIPMSIFLFLLVSIYIYIYIYIYTHVLIMNDSIFWSL